HNDGLPGGETRRHAPVSTPRPVPRSARAAIQPDSVLPVSTRSRRARNPWVVFGNGVITLVLLGAVVVGGGLYLGKLSYDAKGPVMQEKTVVIPRGAGTADIADALMRAGVIDSPLLFSTATRMLKTADELKAGEYLFTPGISMRGVVDLLVEGKA